MTEGKEVMDVLYANEPTSRNFAQQFHCKNQIITHKHQVEVSHQNQETTLEIRNHFAVKNAMGLEKITEIVLENRIIRIIDTFEAATDPTYTVRKDDFSNQSVVAVRKSQNLRKYTILKPQEEVEEMHKSKDTKNVVKNIIRLFQGWLEEGLPKSREIYDQLCSFITDIKFNNHLIMRMIKQRPIREAFLLFGRRDGEQFIEKSKIHDKPTHMEALKKYLELFEYEVREEMENQALDAQDVAQQSPVLIRQQ